LSKDKKSRRSEKAGITNFSKEMVSAFLMAFVFIVYIIQAFKIPTGSMENSLLAGDFLLGLKFIYGSPVLPFSYAKFPGVTRPKPGDVVIFKYPGTDAKDYIKRCVAGPGQTIEVKQKKVYVDNKLLKMPPNGKYYTNGILLRRDGSFLQGIINFNKLRIPAKGDTLYPESMTIREFLFCKHLIHQENPELSFSARVMNTPVFRSIFPYKPGKERIKMKFSVYINDEFKTNLNIPSLIDNWIDLDDIIGYNIRILQRKYSTIDTTNDSLSISVPDIKVINSVYLDGKRVGKYVVKHDNYFMMGDNRDNSADSRYWGYLNRNFVKAKAFILYFSWAKNYEHSNGEEKLFSKSTYKYRDGSIATNNDSPEKLRIAFTELQPQQKQSRRKLSWNYRGELNVGRTRSIPAFFLPLKIRWNRIGKLIRGCDGLGKEEK
jgi:signal peptidase I